MLIRSGGKLIYEPRGAKVIRAAARTASRSGAHPNGFPMRSNGEAAGVPSCRGAREHRAAARLLRRHPGDHGRNLKFKSVSAATRVRYQKAVDDFESWVADAAVPTFTETQLDTAIERYFEIIFIDGAQLYEARNVLWGLAFERDFLVSFPRFPKAHRAMRGWSRSSPEALGLPCPWAAAVVISHILASVGVEQLGPSALHSARAIMISFDSYIRPSTTLSITAADILPPRGAVKYFTLITHPAAEDLEGAPSDLHRASHGRPRARASKTGHFDNAVLMGDPPPRKAGRAFVTLLLRGWRARLSPSARVFPIELAEYEKHLRWATRALDIANMKITPHSMRHGGASSDAAASLRTLPEIQCRGMWSDPRSVARYHRPGQLARQMAKLPPAVLERFPDALRELPKLLR